MDKVQETATTLAKLLDELDKYTEGTDCFYIERDSSSGEINRVEIKHIFTSTVTLVYPKESKKNG